MKPIEQKLKADANKFEPKFDENLHNKIINQLDNITQESSNNLFIHHTKSLAISGLAVVFIGLLLLSWLNKRTDSTNPKTTQQIQVQVVELTDTESAELNLQNIAANIEAKMTNPILKEQQALINDMNHIRELIFLN